MRKPEQRVLYPFEPDPAWNERLAPGVDSMRPTPQAQHTTAMIARLNGIRNGTRSEAGNGDSCGQLDLQRVEPIPAATALAP
jgi:hypothetical protein